MKSFILALTVLAALLPAHVDARQTRTAPLEQEVVTVDIGSEVAAIVKGVETHAAAAFICRNDKHIETVAGSARERLMAFHDEVDPYTRVMLERIEDGFTTTAEKTHEIVENTRGYPPKGAGELRVEMVKLVEKLGYDYKQLCFEDIKNNVGEIYVSEDLKDLSIDQPNLVIERLLSRYRIR